MHALRTNACMNPVLGWALAATLIVFWLVLQFNRTVRAMKNAADAPVGLIDNAVMFNARLRAGMALVQVIAVTKSLGRKVSDAPEVWRWQDAAGSSVTLVFDKARLQRWTLERPAAAPEQEPPPAP